VSNFLGCSAHLPTNSGDATPAYCHFGVAV
jgi:hypothetical protein